MKENRLYCHLHFSAILKKLRPSVIISLIPLIEQLLHPANFSPASLSIGTAATTVVFLWGILSYRSFTYRLTPNGIKLKNGLIIRRIFTIPYNKLRVLTFSQGITERLTGGVSVFFDTAAVLHGHRDIPVCLPVKNAERVKELFSERYSPIYRCSAFGALFSAALLSEPEADILLLIPFLSQTAALTGSGIHALSAGYDLSLRLLTAHDMKSIIIFSELFLSLWLTAVLIRAVRLIRLSSSVSGKYAVTERGILTRVISFSRLDSIASLVMEQSGIMYLLNRNNIFIYTTGYEPKGREKNLFAPAQRESLFQELKTKSFHFDTDEKYRIAPPKKSILSYLWGHIICMLIISACGVLCMITGFHTTGMLILFLIPLVLRRIIFILLTFGKYHASLGKNHICICTCNKMKLKSYYIPFGRVRKTIIKQNPLQRKKHTCTLRLYLYCEKTVCIQLRHINEKDVREFINAIKY